VKLLSISTARAIWFFHQTDLNPRGKAVERNAIVEIGRRYKFAKIPTPAELVDARQKNEPVVYPAGEFQSPSGTTIEVALTAYRDALFADTRSNTSDSEAFLVDMLEWLTSKLGLVDYKTISIRKMYVSEIYVALDNSLSGINPKLKKFVKSLTEKMKTPFKDIYFDVGSLSFWIDPALKHTHVPFRLERQVDVGFDEGRYYSIAPFETDVHLEAVAELEKLLTG
jgi:hypothetical protein